MSTTPDTVAALLPACPPWCRYNEDPSIAFDHGYDSTDGDGYPSRFHEASWQSDLVTVAREERRLPDGRLELGAPFIAVEDGRVDAVQARGLAAALVAAADLAERISS